MAVAPDPSTSPLQQELLRMGGSETAGATQLGPVPFPQEQRDLHTSAALLRRAQIWDLGTGIWDCQALQAQLALSKASPSPPQWHRHSSSQQ